VLFVGRTSIKWKGDSLSSRTVKVADVKVGDRFRKNIGDLSGLVRSIKDVGLLHPIVVSEKNELIAGKRRLRAFQLMGLSEIPATTVNLADLRKGEVHENMVREDFICSEIIAIDEAYRPEVSEAAKERQEATQIKEGRVMPQGGANLAPPSKTRDVVASFVGKSHGSLDKLRAIGKAVKAEPERFGVILAQVDNGRKSIDKAYNEIKHAKETKTELEFTPKVFTVWNFSKCNEHFGVPDFPGRVPAQIVQNVLHYYSEKGDFVVDPMAGSGTTEDVCRVMERKSLSLDISPIRKEIVENDIRNGFPTSAKNCDLIFLDPPYFKKLANHERYAKDYITDRNLWLQFMGKLAKDCFETVKPSGIVALLISDYVDEESSLLTCEYFNIFVAAGFRAINRIQVPLTTQQYANHDVTRALEEKKTLNISRDLYIFRKC
jgi:DNA modification methylase